MNEFYQFYHISLIINCSQYHMQCKSSQKHKHCKPNCVMHNSFAKSLRKYDTTSHRRTASSYGKTIEKEKQLNRKQSLITLIKPFKPVMQPNQSQYTQHDKQLKDCLQNSQSIKKLEIQSYLLKVSLPHKNKQSQPHHGRPQQTTIQASKSAQIYAKQQTRDQKGGQLTKQHITFSAQYSAKDLKHKQMSLVKSKDLTELQFNVERISNIIDSFNRKLGKYEPSIKTFHNNDEMKNSEKQQQKVKYDQTLYDSPFNSNMFANLAILNESPQQVSPLHEYYQEYKANQISSKQNLSQAPSTCNGKSVVDSKKLNYKMFNWSTKAQSMGGSRRRHKGKCHGGVGAFAI